MVVVLPLFDLGYLGGGESRLRDGEHFHGVSLAKTERGVSHFQRSCGLLPNLRHKVTLLSSQCL